MQKKYWTAHKSDIRQLSTVKERFQQKSEKSKRFLNQILLTVYRDPSLTIDNWRMSVLCAVQYFFVHTDFLCMRLRLCTNTDACVERQSICIEYLTAHVSDILKLSTVKEGSLSKLFLLRAGTLAQWLAHRTGNLMIDGSNPGRSNQNLAGLKWLLSKSVFQTLVSTAKQKSLKNRYYVPNNVATIQQDGFVVNFDRFQSKFLKISKMLEQVLHRKAQNTWHFVKKRRTLCSGAKERKMLCI